MTAYKTLEKFCSYFGTLFFILCLPGYGVAQEESIEEKPTNRNKLTLAISHTHLPDGINDKGDKVWQVLPSWGLDYDLRISQKWGLGVHSDIVIQDFAYEEKEGITKKRSYPVATAFVTSYKAARHLALIAGGGAEFAPEGTLGLVVDGSYLMNGNSRSA